MKGTKRTSVIAIALALVLALSVLVGAGIAPTVNENGTQPVNNEGTADGVITFNVVCDCHGNPVDATITGTAHYVLDPDSVVQPAEPTTTPSAEPTPTPTTTVEPSEDQVSTQADDQLNDPADDSSDADDPSDENQEQEQPKPDPTKDEKFEGKVADIEIAKTLTEENGAKYDLTSVKITSVSAAGFKTNDELPKTVEAAEIENGAISLTMGAIAPSISNVNWNVTKGEEGYGDLTYSANEMAYAVLIRDDKAVEDVKNKEFPTVLGTNKDDIKKALRAYDGKLRIGNKTTIWFPEGEDGITNSNDPSDPYPYTAKFKNVTNDASERVIVTVNSHGIAAAQVINKCFSYTIDPESGWSQYKNIEVTIDNIQALLNKGAKYIELVRTDNNGNEVVEKQQDLTNKTTTVTAKATVDGDYTIRAYHTYKNWRGETKTSVDESLTFNVPQIDNDKPTVTIDSTGDVINHIDVTASDTYSGVAGIYLSKVNFGYTEAKDADGKLITDSFTVYKEDPNNAGTMIADTDANIELPVYASTYTHNGMEEVIKGQFAVKLQLEKLLEEAGKAQPTATDVKDYLEAAKDAATVAAINYAKNYFTYDSTQADIIANLNKNIGETEQFNSEKAAKAATESKVLSVDGSDSYDAIVVWAKDDAGNYSNIKVITATGNETNGKMVIDNTAPVVNSVEVKTLNDDSYSNSSKINIKATIKDSNIAENGVYATLFDKDGNAVKDYKKIDLSRSSDNEYTAEVTGVPDGDGYTIVVYAEDKAGNTSYTVDGEKKTPNEEAATSSAFSVDTVAPKLSEMPKFTLVETKESKTQTKNNDANFYGGYVEFSLKVDDEHFASGVLEYTKDGNPVEPKASFTKNDLIDGVYTLPKLENDADYQMVSLTLEDEAGNKTVYKFVKDEKNKVEPSVEVTAENKGNYDSYELPLITLDRTYPTINVKYNNNDVRNDKYFNAERTATITINETNFNGNINWGMVNTNGEMKSGVYIVCSKNGAEVKNKPADLDPSDWTTDKDNEDKHTMTIKYDPDANYTFDVYVVDRAGNYTAYEKKATEDAVSPTDFTVDKTKPTITVTGITNGTAYNGEVAGTVEFSDINFNSATIKITRADKNGVYDVTAQHAGATPVRGNGGTVSIANFDRLLTNDGIYTLTATAIDMAGNEADPVTVTFSVNRFGSTYKFDDYLASICDKHIKSVTDDLKITEINPDSITSGTVTITRNGKVIDSGDIAAVLQRSGSASGGWYEYLYTISKDLFKEDGMYKIVVSSKDAAGNEPNSENDEEFEIVFWVDDTPAEIAGIQGLEDAIINAENHTVKFTVRDNIGLKSVTVYCDGKEIAKFGEKDFTAGDLVDAQFTISEASSAQHIRIVAEDLSGNILDTDGTIEGSANTTVSFERDVTVSTNFFVRWFANKPLFFGSIAVIVAAGVGIYFIVAKKHKKEKATAE